MTGHLLDQRRRRVKKTVSFFLPGRFWRLPVSRPWPRNPQQKSQRGIPSIRPTPRPGAAHRAGAAAGDGSVACASGQGTGQASLQRAAARDAVVGVEARPAATGQRARKATRWRPKPRRCASKLIETAARIETLERARISADTQIEKLEEENKRLSAGFANDRVAVTRLLAVLQRLQHDMPPALAMHPNDALSAARGAMLIGASLPPVYAQAASPFPPHRGAQAHARPVGRAAPRGRLRPARASRGAGRSGRAFGAKGTRGRKRRRDLRYFKESTGGVIAREAADFQALLSRVKALRNNGTPEESVVIVTAENSRFRAADWPGIRCWNRWWEP